MVLKLFKKVYWHQLHVKQLCTMAQRKAAMSQAPPQLCSFFSFFILFVIYSALFCIVHSDKASPIISYDREQPLLIGLTVKNTFSPPPAKEKETRVAGWRPSPAEET